MNILLAPIILPLLAAGCVFILPQRLRLAKEALAVIAAGATLWLAAVLFGRSGYLSLPWLGTLAEFSLRLDRFSAFIILACAGFGFLVALYSSVFMKGREHAGQFHAYFLISLAFVNGAVLANNLLVMLFFWEGLLATVFGLIAIGRKGAFRTAIKALVIVGITDLCLMLGIALTGHLAGTLVISKISLPLNGAGSAAFILLVIGAVSKAGSMPFHSWIPDAALDAPLPFMALLPAALEKLLGIYFLARICLDLFQLVPGSALSLLVMSVGAVTILLAVMMALIQKDYKKLLAYHAISQVGYMILGIGTMVPAGIVGGLFHMVNNAIYKSGLFFTGGSVERQAGTTDLQQLGGIGAKMPVTFACFLVCAASISGVPPFNGFFSKELIYDAALERGMPFYLLALIGSFFTAASFLKLGHAAFLGRPARGSEKVREAPWTMLAPMLFLAGLCVIFGLFNALPLEKLIQPAVGADRLEGRSFAGLHVNNLLAAVTLAVLLCAWLNHRFGVKTKGSGLKAVDHIHHAPGLAQIYARAEKGWFDPYNIGYAAAAVFSKAMWYIDRGIDWLYDAGTVKVTYFCAAALKNLQPVNFPGYLAWSLAGMALVVLFVLRLISGG